MAYIYLIRNDEANKNNICSSLTVFSSSKKAIDNALKEEEKLLYVEASNSKVRLRPGQYKTKSQLLSMLRDDGCLFIYFKKYTVSITRHEVK